METTATTQKRAILVVGGVLAVVALVLGIVLAGDDGDDDGAGETTTTAAASSEETTSTTASTPSTEPPATVPPRSEDVDVAVFPGLVGGTRFDDPRTLVEAFATQVLGFDTDVVVGDYRQGDSRSGEVAVRPTSPNGQGPVTTVAVRQISDDTWVVVTAFTDSIQVVVPEAGMVVASPQRLSGAAAAFEGHVDVALYADGDATPIATTFVTGRGDGVLGDFEGELTFEVPEGATHGVLVLSEPSAEDGTTWAATALRVRF